MPMPAIGGVARPEPLGCFAAQARGTRLRSFLESMAYDADTQLRCLHSRVLQEGYHPKHTHGGVAYPLLVYPDVVSTCRDSIAPSLLRDLRKTRCLKETTQFRILLASPDRCEIRAQNHLDPDCICSA